MKFSAPIPVGQSSHPVASDLGPSPSYRPGPRVSDFISHYFRQTAPFRHPLAAELTALRAVPLSSQGAPGASSRLSSTLGCMSCLLLLLELGCKCWGYLCEVHTAQLNVSARCQCSAARSTVLRPRSAALTLGSLCCSVLDTMTYPVSGPDNPYVAASPWVNVRMLETIVC